MIFGFGDDQKIDGRETIIKKQGFEPEFFPMGSFRPETVF